MRPGKSFLLAANASTLNSVRSMANSLASDTKIRNSCPLPVGGKEGLRCQSPGPSATRVGSLSSAC